MPFSIVSGWPRKYDNIAGTARRQNKPALRGVDAGQGPERPAKPHQFDAQPSSMRFIGEPGSKYTCQEHVSRNLSGPGFAQRSCELE
jgi:hypothetical protein